MNTHSPRMKKGSQKDHGFLTLLTNARGQSVIMVTLSSVFLLTLAGFASDLGRIYLTRQNLRKIADAAAMAAVVQTPTHSQAVSIAHGIAELNQTGASAYIDPGEVEVGTYNFQTRTFTAGNPLDEDNNKAVRVMVRRTGGNGSPLNLIFGPFVGYLTMDLTARATAAADVPICGLIGIVDIDVTGTTLVDSYHSASGPYSASNSEDNGTLCSNGPIDIKGSVEVQGDALPGKDDSVTLTGGATVSGSTDPLSSKLILAPIVLGDVAANNDNDQIPLTSSGKDPLDNQLRFSMQGNDELNLPSGTYFFTQMTLTGQALITVAGPVIIYVNGDVALGGGGISNTTQNPNNLQIFVTGANVSYSGSSNFYGLLYAPNANATLSGTAEFFGAVVANDLKINGTPQIHYDEDLDPFFDALRPVPVLVE